ncbi:methionyl-tRNA synthetase [Coccomyxa subellipsoidea C-169]|uniref:methionine--tRNA ligase n=1 Tax=Coccomyxa subellipsoidea (strain C-169) TaxID=574566 RepID=I0Z940_COCSC|nr:methionyl-tRNA synthetase [Coccomyxa subellipsoidea C-169]EIE27159.1 methionyl-tRNA synthetase [Coccomyxa subellipsoidea C-169]|eukprot:XP_005651703.1 methionyl-tRNA synthetase [Coccomyxa subellipsoidea C-169]
MAALHTSREALLAAYPLHASRKISWSSWNLLRLRTQGTRVNAEPHMGSAYTTMAADAITRFQRLRGKRVSFVTGTDEHGEKIAEAAAKKGQEPQQHCDGVVASFKGLWEEMDIQYDSFIRTTDPKHATVVRAILDRVWEKGDIYKAKYEGWYCVGCEAYKDDSEMEGDHACPFHKTRCVEREEENYFFALSKYQQQIQRVIEEDKSFVQPAARRNEVLGWVEAGLRDFSISRAAVSWGIPIPRDPAQTVYVWFDALLGYMSALLPEGASPDEAELAARGWPADVHLVGKDILRFHALYWPGMLLSAGLPLPRKIFAHGFLTKDGMKMGKSLGNILEPRKLLAAYGSDAVRFYFLKEVVFGQDGDFSEQRFRDTVNAFLANSVGNLLNRTLGLLRKNCAGSLPLAAAAVPADNPLRAVAELEVAAAALAYEELRLHDALEAVVAIAGRGNLYMEQMAPWTAFKKGTDEEKRAAELALVAVLEAVRIVAVLLSPVTPRLSSEIYGALGYGPEAYEGLSWGDASWGGLPKGQATPPPKPVFARLEGDFVTEVAASKSAAVAA